MKLIETQLAIAFVVVSSLSGGEAALRYMNLRLRPFVGDLIELVASGSGSAPEGKVQVLVPVSVFAAGVNAVSSGEHMTGTNQCTCSGKIR